MMAFEAKAQLLALNCNSGEIDALQAQGIDLAKLLSLVQQFGPQIINLITDVFVNKLPWTELITKYGSILIQVLQALFTSGESKEPTPEVILGQGLLAKPEMQAIPWVIIIPLVIQLIQKLIKK